jgi:ABC-2 type transport system ATP-binding protein
MSIEVSHLKKQYGAQWALEDVSFSIASGAVVGFLGPNGAGKSTTMKIITGFINATSGSVKVCGWDVQENGLQARRHIGYLPENNPLYSEMYVREYLTFTAGFYGLTNRKQRVNEIIDRVKLTPESDKKIKQLSKGYRQRVGLAQALIHDPEVLILDEPTSGLDPNQLEEIRSLIREIGRHKTVLLSTHIMQEVEAICQRAIIIHKGNIVSDELLGVKESDDRQLYVEFAGEISIEALQKIPAITQIAREGKGWLLSGKGGSEFQAAVVRYAQNESWDIISIAPREKRLEILFKELTKH